MVTAGRKRFTDDEHQLQKSHKVDQNFGVSDTFYLNFCGVRTPVSVLVGLLVLVNIRHTDVSSTQPSSTSTSTLFSPQNAIADVRIQHRPFSYRTAMYYSYAEEMKTSSTNVVVLNLLFYETDGYKSLVVGVGVLYPNVHSL